jgi:7,8-dihydroneopterin aldolase/epimerase/oxygenase
MANTIIIQIHDAVINAYVGIYDIEQQQTQPIKISITANMHASIFKAEQLDTTINYENIWQIVIACFKQKWKLLESAAENIAQQIKQNYPNALSIAVTLSKSNAPIPNFKGEVGITYTLN